MNRLTRIDEHLSPGEIFDLFYEASMAFMEWGSLFRSAIFYYCSSDGREDTQLARNQYIAYNQDHDLIIPKTISEGHVIDLSSFGIFSRNLFDLFFAYKNVNIEVLPSNGVILPPILTIN
jgi:hypothetical protein